jgi:hypothetical protein
MSLEVIHRAAELRVGYGQPVEQLRPLHPFGAGEFVLCLELPFAGDPQCGRAHINELCGCGR